MVDWYRVFFLNYGKINARISIDGFGIENDEGYERLLQCIDQSVFNSSFLREHQRIRQQEKESLSVGCWTTAILITSHGVGGKFHVKIGYQAN